MLNISSCIVQTSVRTPFTHIKSTFSFLSIGMFLFRMSCTVAYKIHQGSWPVLRDLCYLNCRLSCCFYFPRPSCTEIQSDCAFCCSLNTFLHFAAFWTCALIFPFPGLFLLTCCNLYSFDTFINLFLTSLLLNSRSIFVILMFSVFLFLIFPTVVSLVRGSMFCSVL